MPVFKNTEGATPIDDVSGLIPAHIMVKKELDEWESENVLFAVRKYLSKKKKFEMNAWSLKRLHKDMFGKTWEWAGSFRLKEVNIGVKAALITVEVKKLADDFVYWRDKKIFDIFGQAIRLHHRLVQIHPFPNGNGRHARLAADIILHNAGHVLPSWPERDIVENTDIRKQYISALKTADAGDYGAFEIFIKKLIK